MVANGCDLLKLQFGISATKPIDLQVAPQGVISTDKPHVIPTWQAVSVNYMEFSLQLDQ